MWLLIYKKWKGRREREKGEGNVGREEGGEEERREGGEKGRKKKKYSKDITVK
jgi:hypothetical protein